MSSLLSINNQQIKQKQNKNIFIMEVA